MKRLHFAKPNNLSRLHDELLAAIPTLRPIPNARGENEPVMAVEGRGDDIWLTVPDDADEAAIAAIVQAHDATRVAPRVPDPDLAAWNAATTLPEVKAILARRLGIR